MPKTPPGKARSRLNALKHGLRATDEIFLAHLNDHDRAIFQDFRRQFHRDYRPRTKPEKLLVDRIAIQHFRLFRLYSLEYQAADLSASKLLSRDSVIQHLDRFTRYDWRIERQLRILHNQLRSLYISRNDFSLNLFSNKY